MDVVPLIALRHTDPVIRKLRALQHSGVITPAHCLRAVRYVERHLANFCDWSDMSVGQAADVAVGYTAFAI